MSDDNSKPSFLNDLAAKLAAGPPKKPIGLLKKSNIAERAEEEAKEQQQKQKQSGSEPSPSMDEGAYAAAQTKLAGMLTQVAQKQSEDKKE